MTQNELRKILDVMELNEPHGVGVISLSNLTGIKAHKLRKYLVSYRDYFVQLPDSQKFAINRFGKFNGIRSEIVKWHEQALAKDTSSKFLLYFLLLVAATTSISVAVSIAT